MLIKKIPDTSGLVATTNMNTKMIEVENKIPNTSNLVNQKLVKLRKKFLVMLNILLLKNVIS